MELKTQKDKALEIYTSFFSWMNRESDAYTASCLCVEWLLKEEVAYRNGEDVEEYYYEKVLEELKNI